MKILHIVPAYKPAYIYGGPTESVARLCEGLAADGHEVDVYTTTANGKTELDVVPGKEINVDGVNVIYFKRLTGDPTNITPSLWVKLAKTAKDYDMIHMHAWWNTLVLISAQICFLKGAKTIIAPRGMLSKYIFGSGSSKAKTITHNLIGRSILARCYLHATSDAEYDECRELIPGWKGFVLPNIIALPDISIFPYQNEVFTLIFLSRVHPKKGLEVLFEAMSKISFKILLRIAGTGDEDYIAQLKQLSVELKVDDQIEWLGWRNRDEKFVEMMKADLFVLPSLNENFANVVIESLHVGTAVLVTEQVGLANFVKVKNTGWVSRLDATDLAEKIKEARQDIAKLTHIRAHGRDIIEENFSEKVLIRQYISEYQKINASVA